MENEQRVKYLFVNMTVTNFKKLQVVLIVMWIIGMFLSYVLLRDHSFWIFRNLWWICIIAAVGETIESFIALKRAVRSPEDKVNSG
ncbi:hypothetical protein M1N13_03985 [Dehalococcoidia bacterium]|nr:hypothetical protein [Dehalococcoidia bacterium]MCL0064283.1 hypothetical protein [Dehalococcoidia bacterium]